MSHSGVPDPLYVAAREVLLDGLEALGPHASAVVLVGAQAVYLHTGDAELALVPHTTDADFALDVNRLASAPLLEEIMQSAGFRHGSQPGIWMTSRKVEDEDRDIELDLLVPDSLGGGGTRGARIPNHGKMVARKARGLEAALVDKSEMEMSSLGSSSTRRARLVVAGPSALLISKLHKLGEREQTPKRLKLKDALDVLRLLRAVPIASFSEGMKKLRADSLSAATTNEGLRHLQRLFSERTALGAQLAARATMGVEPEDVIVASCAALTAEFLAEIPVDPAMDK